jgi:hypothetical protein
MNSNIDQLVSGIYGAAAFTTCAHRAGSLYHERQDAAWYKANGVDYLKYDDCGEANIQSYVKYFVMKDALDAAPGGGLDYYSYEPFQIYAAGAVEQMSWVSHVGDAWRSSNDIRPIWKSVLANAFLTNKWAPNARPGHYNDADALEVGNGKLTLEEQRSHFALWCVMKSPLIIGTDVRALSPASLAVLKNKHLLAVNQDELGVQGTLRASFDASGKRAPRVSTKPVACVYPTSCAQASPWVTPCAFGSSSSALKLKAPAQLWEARGERLVQSSTNMCLTRSSASSAGGSKQLHPARASATQSVGVEECSASSVGQLWDLGAANVTVAQVRDAEHASSCLTFNSSSLHVAPCKVEHGDKNKPNPTECRDGNCRFSGIVDQLWYLNSLGQFTSAITNIPNGADQRMPMLPHFAPNTPWCLASSSTAETRPTAPTPTPPPAVDTSQPLQVWAGPLSGGDFVVLLFNTGNVTAAITANWLDIGLDSGAAVHVTDMWTGAVQQSPREASLTAKVASHDCAVYRLSPAR